MFFAKDKMTTAIDISDGLAKFVTISVDKGQKYLHALDSIELRTDNDREISKELRSLMSRHRLGKSYFYVNFPRHLVTIRNVRLPTVNVEEVRNMAELQAVKYLPYAREEMVVDHKIIGLTEEGYTEILLILAQRKFIERYIEIFKYAGIQIEKIALSSEGLLSWYLGLQLDDILPIAIIDFDRYHTHIQIVKNKKMLFSRSVYFDALNPTSDRNALVGEIRLSFDSFLKEQGERVSRMVLTGGEDNSKDMPPFLKDNFSIPCEWVEQLKNIDKKDTADKFLHHFRTLSCTPLLGIVLEGEKLTVNLLPRDIIDRRKEEALKSELLRSTALLLSVLVVAFGIVEKKIYDKKVYLRNIDSRLKAIEPEVKRLSKVKENIELIQNQLMFRSSSIDVIRELHAILPQDTSLTLFEFDDKNKILLRGTAKELSNVFDLLPILEKSPYFENVKINYAKKRTFKQREFADFEITCVLR